MSRTLQVYIPVGVEIDLDTGRKKIVEIGSDCWPHSACPEIYNPLREEWEPREDWPAVSEDAHDWLTKELREHLL